MIYIVENPIKMDDLRVPLFSETSIWEQKHHPNLLSVGLWRCGTQNTIEMSLSPSLRQWILVIVSKPQEVIFFVIQAKHSTIRTQFLSKFYKSIKHATGFLQELNRQLVAH